MVKNTPCTYWNTVWKDSHLHTERRENLKSHLKHNSLNLFNRYFRIRRSGSVQQDIISNASST
jgi:hypothetical protein